jgi:hypothetical protein
VSWSCSAKSDGGLDVGVLAVEAPRSEGSDSVVEKDAFGLRSTSEVSKVMLTDVGCVILGRCIDVGTLTSGVEVDSTGAGPHVSP